jgi:hypothetical protein
MQRLTEICARHPWATVALTLILTAAAGWSALHTGTAVGTDATLGRSHPAVREFDSFLKRFGGGYPVVVAYECAASETCGGVFDPTALEMADTVTRQLLKAPFVSRVSSPAATRLLVPTEDSGLDARGFVVDGAIVNDPQLVARALVDPLWSRTIVSSDGRVGAIVVDLSSTDGIALSTTMDAIRSAISPFEDGRFHFFVVGEAAMFVASQEAGLESAVKASAFTGAMLFIALLVLLRSLPAVIATLAVIGVSAAWTIGLLPIIGWQQSELTNGAATLILVVGCADCVHFVTHYLEKRSHHANAVGVLRETAGWVLAPCFLTTATTVAAFVSFASSGVLALTQFGLLAAIGVSFAFALTFTFFPAALVLLRTQPRELHRSAAWQEILSRIARVGVERRHLVLSLSLIAVIVGAIGIGKLQVEMSISDLWGSDHPVKRSIDFVSSHLQHPDRLEVDIELAEGSNLEDASSATALISVEAALSRVDAVENVYSFIVPLRRISEILSSESRMPGNSTDLQVGIGELLVLASAGTPGVLDTWISLDQRRTRFSIEVKDLSMQEKARLVHDVDQLLREHLPDGWSYSITGPLVLASRYGDDFSRSQANIVSASSFLVVAMIGIYLRSLPWALLAAIPNAVALVLMFGTMGHWNILLNFGSAIVAPIAIGIAADDTIHFLTQYSRERRSGLEPVVALHRSISGVGEAVIATAVALALGFLSMMTSSMASVADMGLLCAIAIVGATVADLLVLPALIATVAQWRGFQRLPEIHG